MNNWLYTYTLEGKCYDADRTEYEMVLMSRCLYGAMLHIKKRIRKKRKRI